MLTALGGLLFGFAIARYQVRAQAKERREASQLADRQQAYQLFLWAADMNHGHANRLRAHLDLIAWRDPLDKMMGVKPPRDFYDLDAALAPAQAELLRAGVGVRLHGSPEGIRLANDLAQALVPVMEFATAGAAGLDWLHGIVWRNITRRLHRPDPLKAKREAADTDYFARRRKFENLVRAECGITTIDDTTDYLTGGTPTTSG